MHHRLTKQELALHFGSVLIGMLLLVAGTVLHTHNAMAGNGWHPSATTTTTTTASSSWSGYATTTTHNGSWSSNTDGEATTTATVSSTTITDIETTITNVFLVVPISAQAGACGTGRISLTWGLDEPNATYNLFRNGTKIYDGKGKTYEDSGLSAGVSRSYVVYIRTTDNRSGAGSAYAVAPQACQTTTSTDTGTTISTSSVTTNTGVTSSTSAAVTTTVVATPPPSADTVPTQPPPAPVPTPTPAPVPTVATQPAPAPIVRNIERELTPATTTPALLSGATEQKIAKLFTVVSVFDETGKARVEARQKLVGLVDKEVRMALAEANGNETIISGLKRVRADLITHIDEGLNSGALESDAFANSFVEKLNGLSAYGVTPDTARVEEQASEALVPLAEATAAEAKALKEQGGDELYKDTNKDGISDYDSVHVYNIDPVKPAPTSVYEGRRVTAGEKIMLGFDPAKAALVKVEPEEPEASAAPIASSYIVSSIALTPDAKVALAGRALPNSYVTLYIYSTPVVVTVKTDANGAWSYTLNKELADGGHKVSVATVDNSGKILAKSTPIPFTKTAQAATLDSDVPLFATGEHPSLFSGSTMLVLVLLLLGVILLTLGIIGLTTRKQAEAAVAAP